MAISQIRGSTQIIAGTITLDRLVSGLALPSSQLADGANFIKKDGTVAYTGNQSMGGFTLSMLADAVNPQDGVNLRTAQALINGIQFRSAWGVSVSNQALTGLPTVDSTTFTAGLVILLAGQTTASQNGLWTVNAGAWTRPTNWAAASTQQSTMFLIEQGTIYHDSKWIMMTDNVVIDTTATTIQQDLSGVNYTNGSGLSLTGSTFAVKLLSTGGLSFDGSSNVQIALNGSSLNLSASGLKIADGVAGQLLMAGVSNVATYTAMSGDVTISSTGVASINHVAGTGFLKYTDLVSNETPSGAINGSNTAFTLTAAPQVNSLELFVNGALQEPGAGNDYTVTGTAITMLYALSVSDKLRAYYMK